MTSLRDVFGTLTHGPRQDPREVLDAHGFGDLPDTLVSWAIVNHADTAPVETAAHLAPFVRAHSGLPFDGPGFDAEPADGLRLLATAPAPQPRDEVPELDPGPAEPPLGRFGADPVDLDFGEGDPGAGPTGVAGDPATPGFDAGTGAEVPSGAVVGDAPWGVPLDEAVEPRDDEPGWATFGDTGGEDAGGEDEALGA